MFIDKASIEAKMALVQKRWLLILQYDIQEQSLMELINDLSHKRATPGNLLFIETVLEGKFSSGNQYASAPFQELMESLVRSQYLDMALKAEQGHYRHQSTPVKRPDEAIDDMIVSLRR